MLGLFSHNINHNGGCGGFPPEKRQKVSIFILVINTNFSYKNKTKGGAGGLPPTQFQQKDTNLTKGGCGGSPPENRKPLMGIIWVGGYRTKGGAGGLPPKIEG